MAVPPSKTSQSTAEARLVGKTLSLLAGLTKIERQISAPATRPGSGLVGQGSISGVKPLTQAALDADHLRGADWLASLTHRYVEVLAQPTNPQKNRRLRTIGAELRAQSGTYAAEVLARANRAIQTSPRSHSTAAKSMPGWSRLFEKYRSTTSDAIKLSSVRLPDPVRATKARDPSAAWQPAQVNAQLWRAFAPPRMTALVNAFSDAPGETRPGGNVASKVVKAAKQQLGKPYVWGARGPNAFDCSGLVQNSYAQAGVNIPRDTWHQFADRKAAGVTFKNLKPGDAMYFDTNGGQRDATHVGIYVGNNRMIVAPHAGAKVRVEPINTYWKSNFLGARRWQGAPVRH